MKTLALSANLCLGIFLSGCEMQTPQDAAVAQLSNCDKIMALVSEHRHQFKVLRRNPNPTPKITVWDARHHLVGKDCQVWQWGGGKFDYMCVKVAPSQEIAQGYFERAKTFTSECLGNNWSLSERPRKLGTGTKATYTRSGSPTAVAIHVVETNGLLNKEWSTYFFVGDTSDEI